MCAYVNKRYEAKRPEINPLKVGSMSVYNTGSVPQQQEQQQQQPLHHQYYSNPPPAQAIEGKGLVNAEAKVKEINKRYLENQYINYLNYVNELQVLGFIPIPFALSDVAPHAIENSMGLGRKRKIYKANTTYGEYKRNQSQNNPDNCTQNDWNDETTNTTSGNNWTDNNNKNNYNSNRPFKPRNNYGGNKPYGDGKSWKNNNYGGGNRQNQGNNDDGWNNEPSQNTADDDDGWGDLRNETAVSATTSNNTTISKTDDSSKNPIAEANDKNSRSKSSIPIKKVACNDDDDWD